MSKTWRERIAEARTRGGFLPDDIDHLSVQTCAAAEAVGAVGETARSAHERGWSELWRNAYGTRFVSAVLENRPDDAERELERIEDRVLQLKREQSA